ncbi:hypothetical protein UC8_25690 [Roseimaritima ulvae]|uniref:Flippase-like domain-containing protein n=2 Tax=Roseimaritima ulvae TaxID=980254 RepID=A0A5B9QNK6_9BACT|nr:hypothetical protein UC8_25690 [Roseimaritima ulvae]
MVVILIVVIGLSLTLRDALREFSQDPAKRQLLLQIRWPALALAGCSYALALLPAGIYWFFVLRRFAVPVGLWPAVAAHVQGHLGKYVPGKAMVVVLRVGAIAGPGVRPLPATVAVFIETLTMMATGGALAGIVIAFADVPGWLVALACGLVLSASIPTIPPLFRAVVRIANSRRAKPGDVPLEAYDGKTFAAGWFWMSLTWILIGAAFALIVYSLVPTASGDDLLLASAAMALAVVAGFVSLLPGGAGVREWILAAVLAPRIGAAEALTAALLARLLFLAVELLAAAIAAAVLRRHRAAAGGEA